MITGNVNDGEARIRLKVRGRGGRQRTIEAAIDTGFNGNLSLPSSIIAALDLNWLNATLRTLADGSECSVDVYYAAVEWDGQVKHITVDAANTDPLIGMALLDGYELKEQVRERGKVSIKRL